MTNKMNCWICDSKKISKINIVCNKKVEQLFCNECCFVFKNTSIEKSKRIKYYSDLSLNKLKERYHANEYFDTARFINYIDLVIKKNSNLKKKINHLDIGGGYGFFSKVLQNQYNKINSFNLEPDKNAALVAKKYNKNVKIINLRFEDIHRVKNIKFDLVTYWGGVYRTIEPNRVFENLKKVCSKNCDFFFSLPFSFDDMRIQHLELQNSFDDYLLKDDANKSLFGRKHMKIFLSKNNFFYKEILIQNKPFKKIIPIFYFKLKKKQKKIKINKKEFKNYFLKNINIYNKYFENEIKKLKKNKEKTNKIIIFGNNFLNKKTFNFLKNKKYKNLFVINSKLEELYNDKKKLKLMLEISNIKSNIIIIFPEDNKKNIKYTLINRLHLNLNNKIFCLKNQFNSKEDVFSFYNKKFLKRKFVFEKI